MKLRARRLAFRKIQRKAELLNCVLERESKGYSLYDNTRSIEDECPNLTEVMARLNEIEDMNEVDQETLFAHTQLI